MCNAGEVCCFKQTGSTGGGHCGMPGQCGAGYFENWCSSPAGCPGAVCCAHWVMMMSIVDYQGVSCAASCSDATSEFVVCDQQPPNVCPAGTTCYASAILGPGYNVCHP
jgi:hypothetical protein